jgi:hypothetical protein
MRRSSALLLLVFASSIGACHGDRPRECQKLRQCCDAVRQTGADMEPFRVPCTRKDDDDAVLCRRRLDDVVQALPSMADHEDCRMPSSP